MKTIEDLLIDAMDRMDRARKLLSIQSDNWQMLNTEYMRDAYVQIKARTITKSFDSGGHSFTESMLFDEALSKVPQDVKDKVDQQIDDIDINDPPQTRKHSSIEPPPGYIKIYLGRGDSYKTPDMDEPKKAHRDVKGHFFFKRLAFVPCNHCDEAGCTFNCIGKKKEPESYFSLSEALDRFDKACKQLLEKFKCESEKALKSVSGRAEVANASKPVGTLEQKVIIAKELLYSFMDEDKSGNDILDFENWLNKLK
jgi:hypothetical protein